MNFITQSLRGKELFESYIAAEPFPHAVFLDLWNSDAIHAVADEVKAFDAYDGERDFFGSRKKRQCSTYANFPSKVKAFIDYCNSKDFISFLEDLTGERDLVADPYFEGGGIHSIRAGGFLRVHADFNWHQRLGLFRRLNLLAYLNTSWDDRWGGALELWATDMSRCVKTVAPRLNTSVIFTTDDTSFHGHPDKLGCPLEVTRNSIALYYYSPSRPLDEERLVRRRTNYRSRGLIDAEVTISKGVRKLRSILRRN